MSTEAVSQALAPIIAGPLLRKLDSDSLHLWLATSCDSAIDVTIFENEAALSQKADIQTVHLGRKLYLKFIKVDFEKPLPADTPLAYELNLDGAPISQILEHDLNYAAESTKTEFIWRPKVNSVLHGSCRKAHYGYHIQDASRKAGDGLVEADHHLRSTQIEQWPSLMVLSGDQIYADDVAGPMLHAIRQAITLLGIEEEAIPNAEQPLSEQPYFYQREALLPQSDQNDELNKQFFKGKKKPVFTTDTAHNHLMSFAEVICMYLLVWSPTLWRHISLERPDSINKEEHRLRYDKERKAIEEFVEGLPQVQRVLAHIPSAMMFDDHDVTDDWNLTAEWEQTAFGHPLSKRIIGNALFGYLLCQGWGNNPAQYDHAFIKQAETAALTQEAQVRDTFIDELLAYDQWHYHWDTQPKLVVLDTRTRRWRSEKSFSNPSGLMDWEAITDLQQDIKNLDSVILVSPAPMFGVKLIEAIQKVFTWIGKPLMVDAENWMAHPGSAYALMNLFTHAKTPTNFVILSGDVHYSFAYDIKLRGHKSSPNIWQITSSGLRNEFPHDLLEWFDRLNRWLYAPWSPLNLFTKRRSLRISPRKPDNADHGERLLNHSGIGLVHFDDQGRPSEIAQLCKQNERVIFLSTKRS